MAGAVAAAVVLGGCASHEPERIDPLAILERLEELRLESVASVLSGVTLDDGLTLDEASALALRHSPELAAARARLAPLRVEVERADVWPDPQAGWSTGDVVGDLSGPGGPTGPSFVSGPSLFLELPRPGELSAKVAVATARLQRAVEEKRALEARVVRDVRLAYVELLVARGLVTIAREQADVAERLRADLITRRAAGEATALELELVNLPVEQVLAELPALDVGVEVARQRLNALLGLPPDDRWRPASDLDALQPPAPPAVADEERLLRLAIARRPDVAAALWAHREADAELALERARRWPRVWIGTGILFDVPVFSRLNRYGVEQALRAREAARARVVAAVHAARAEVHAALARARAAHRTVVQHAQALEDSARSALTAADTALASGQLPLIEVLQARGRAIAARREALEARRAWLEAAIELQAATGELAPSPPPPPDEEK